MKKVFLEAIAVAAMALVLGAFTGPVEAANLQPSSSPADFSSAKGWSEEPFPGAMVFDGDFAVESISPDGTVVTLHPLSRNQQGGKWKGQVYCRWWWVNTSKGEEWQLAAQSWPDGFSVAYTITPDGKYLRVTSRVQTSKGDGARYMLRWWGEEGSEGWLEQPQNNAVAYPDDQGSKGAQIQVNLKKGTWRPTPSGVKPDIVKPH